MTNKVFKRMAAAAAALAFVFGGTGISAANFEALNLGITAAATSPEGTTYTDGDYSYVMTGNGTAKITKYSGSESKVKIPGTVGDDIRVTEIGRNAFYEVPITGVMIPDTVEKICDYAFYRCMELNDLRISSKVEYIDSGAFSMCKSLKSVTLPKNLKSIGDTAFYGCDGLTEITIPANVSSIKLNAFQKCTNLKTINVDSNNRYFASVDGAMYNRKKTELMLCPEGKDSIEFPESVNKIGDGAFMYCARFTELAIPESVLRFGDAAFGSCTGLTEFKIHDKVVRVGDGAFYGCTGLTEITVPESVTYLGASAFAKCENLKTVTINGSIAEIKERTFINCDSLENVVLPESVAAIREEAFYHCNNLKSIALPSSLKVIDYRAFDCCFSLENVVIPEGVRVVRWAAFRSCRNLKTVTLPESLEVIETAALGYYFANNGAGDLTKLPNFTMICTKDSVAEQYAVENGFRYAYVGTNVNPAYSVSVSQSRITIDWQAVPGAEKYGVACFIDGSWQMIAQGTNTSYVMKNLKPGKEYKVAVIAKFDGKWNMDLSNALTVTTAGVYPNVSWQIKNNQLRLKWTAVPGAEKYCVAVYKDNEWKLMAQLNNDVMTYTSPKIKGAYKIAVCAKVEGKWDLSKIEDRMLSLYI